MLRHLRSPKKKKNMATTTENTPQLEHTIASVLHLYYEEQPDGKRILRHIKAHGKEYTTPADGSGITIDVVPPNTIGSEEIINDSVGMEDLKPEVRDAIMAGGTPATDADIDELFPEGGSGQQDGKEYADNSDIDELFNGGGQHNPVQDGDDPVDDEI